jgi:F1F0 ATPase subunit 2
MINNLAAQLISALHLYFPPLLAGIGIGLFFFSTLWITVHKGLQSANPALWFVTGLVVRMSVGISLFYLLGANDWQRLLASLVGFILGRQAIKSLSRLAIRHSKKTTDISHAS